MNKYKLIHVFRVFSHGILSPFYVTFMSNKKRDKNIFGLITYNL